MNNYYGYPASQNKALAGFILVAVGGLFLIKQLGLLFFPLWLFSWPSLIILIGVLSGIKHNFRNPTSFILIGVGTLLLVNHILGFTLSYLFWPIILMAIGLKMIFNGNRYGYRNRWDNRMGYGQHFDVPVE